MQIERDFYAAMIEQKRQVKIFMINGYQVHGIIRETDDDTILVSEQSNYNCEILIYKSAISTIVPT